MYYNEIPYASVVNLLDDLLHLILENVFLISIHFVIMGQLLSQGISAVSCLKKWESKSFRICLRFCH